MEGVFEPGNLFLGSPGALVSARLARTRRPQRFSASAAGFSPPFLPRWVNLLPPGTLVPSARFFHLRLAVLTFFPVLDWAGALRVWLWGLEYKPPCPQAVV